MDHPLAVALSGGGDSMALLHISADWAKRAGRRLVAITVDHGLNPDSPDWSRRCEAAARALGTDWIERHWIERKPTTGLPAAARLARHALIAEAARAAGARVVLFAHTADDIAEADWMRDRGSTIGRLRQWSPSPVWPEGRGLMLLRPMLEERRAHLRAFLRGRGAHWIEDPGNAGFGRGEARCALTALAKGQGSSVQERQRPETRKGERLPCDPVSAQTLPLSATSQRVALRTSSPLPLGGGFETDRSIRATDLAAVLLCASGGHTPPRRGRLESLTARLHSGTDFAATLSGARIEAAADRVLIGREAGELRRRPCADVGLASGRPAVWDGRYEITARETGWIATAALGRLDALSKPDRAIVATAPAWARGALPVLIRDGDPAPVLAWRAAEVRALAPRRLIMALGETTQESDLALAVHGETPPPDLF